MKIQIKKTITILLIICFALSITATTVSASAGDPNSYVVPVDSKFLGNTYSGWSEAWWQWVLSIPASHNPILDTNGNDASIGQSGDVWFLAGTNGVTGVKRTVEIPAGKAIFFPVINVVSFPYPTHETYPELINDVTTYIDKVTVHNVELDGKNLDNFRVRSDLFTFTVPENNYLNLFYPDLPAGSYKGVSDGYWIMLKPLPEGTYKIRIYGKAVFDPKDPKAQSETGVTYTITIKP